MTRFGDFLGKQGRFLLENDNQALIYIAVLALIPFAGWLSAAAIALITLRKGWIEGFRGFVAAFLATLLLSLMTMSFSSACITAVLAFLPCYLTAIVLRSTVSLKVAVGFIVLQALVALILIHWLAPDFISNQFQYFQMLVKELGKSNSDSSALSLVNNQSKLKQTVIANYLVGVQAISIVISALISLMLARSVQSRLFYPGGFRQEILGFQAFSFGLVLLGLAAIGAYSRDPLALSCLPLLVTYFVFAGLSLTFSVVAKDKGVRTFVLLMVPLVILPIIMTYIYVSLGALDSLFDFRKYLSSKTGEKENKG